MTYWILKGRDRFIPCSLCGEPAVTFCSCCGGLVCQEHKDTHAQEVRDRRIREGERSSRKTS